MARSDEDIRFQTPLIMDNTSKSSIPAGKFFSTWFSKGKRKKNKTPESPTIECNLSNNISLESIKPQEKSIEISEVDDNKLTPTPSLKGLLIVEHKDSHEQEVKHESSLQETTSKHSKKFFRKLINKKNNQSLHESPQKDVQSLNSEAQTMVTLSEEVYVTEYNMDESNTKMLEDINVNTKSTNQTKEREDDIELNTLEYTTPIATSYVFNQPQVMDATITDSLREVNEFALRLRESEAHLVQILSKYIGSKSFEKELRNTLTGYAKLHIEAERRAHKLANEMWLQQAELGRTQERALQDTLNAIVKQNRQLLEDNECLKSKNEKLASKYDSYCHRGHLGCSNQLIDSLNKNNEILRGKYNSCLTKLDEYEKELQQLQHKNVALAQHVRNSNVQILNYKVMLDRANADYELEHASLCHQMHLDQSLIKECTEAGDVLIEDLSSLKSQMKSICCKINWTKFKVRGRSLPDLIYLCRSCLNELSKELASAHSQIVLKEKDIEKAKADLELLQVKIINNEAQKRDLSNEIEVYKESQHHLTEVVEKNTELDVELKKAQDKICELQSELEKEKYSSQTGSEEITKLNEKVCDKEARLVETQSKIGDYKTEIESLNTKLNSLNQVLSASGAGDLSRELAVMQEKLSIFQSQYFQVLSEKNSLGEQLECLKNENKTLLEYSHTCFEHIKTLQNTIEDLNASVLTTRDQLELEKSTVAALQNERVKHLDEKNVLGAIYQQLCDDVTRIDTLENFIEHLNKESNRLTVIAEYNKQIGVQLQTEVAERDVTINSLQQNIEKLSCLSNEQSKDKTAISEELMEVSHIKEELNQRLHAEIKKCENYNEYKTELENTREDLKIMHAMQKSERLALKQILLDFEDLTNQRNELLNLHNIQQEQINSLTLTLENEKEKVANTTQENLELGNKLIDTQNNLFEKECTLIEVQKQSAEKFKHQENEIDNFKSVVVELRKERDSMENNLQYLKNNIQKLNAELHNTRESEMDAKRNLAYELQLKEQRAQQFQDLNDALQQSYNENNTLIEQIVTLGREHEKFIIEYEKLRKESQALEDENKNELLASKQLLIESSCEIERLIAALTASKEKINDTEVKIELLEEENEIMEGKLNKFKTNALILEENCADKEQLKIQIKELEKRHCDCDKTINDLLQEIEKLRGKLEVSEKNIEKHNTFYKNYVEDIEKEYGDQRDLMKQDLQTLTARILDLSNEITIKDSSYSKLETLHKDLAAKLLNSVKICIDEKCARQSSENTINNLLEHINSLKSEMEGLEEKISILTREQAELVQRIGELNSDKSHMQNILMDLQNQHQSALTKCDNYEEKLNQLQKECKTLLVSANSAKLRIEETTEYKETQARLKEYEQKIKVLKEGLDNNQDVVQSLQQSLLEAQNENAILEFKKCEVILRLHEEMAKFTGEQNLNLNLKEVNQRTLSTILQMRDSGELNKNLYEILLSVVASPNINT